MFSYLKLPSQTIWECWNHNHLYAKKLCEKTYKCKISPFFHSYNEGWIRWTKGNPEKWKMHFQSSLERLQQHTSTTIYVSNFNFLQICNNTKKIIQVLMWNFMTFWLLFFKNLFSGTTNLYEFSSSSKVLRRVLKNNYFLFC